MGCWMRLEVGLEWTLLLLLLLLLLLCCPGSEKKRLPGVADLDEGVQRFPHVARAGVGHPGGDHFDALLLKDVQVRDAGLDDPHDLLPAVGFELDTVRDRA